MTATTPTRTYSAFGLSVESELRLPQLDTLEPDDDPDVTVTRGPIDTRRTTAGEKRHQYPSPSEFHSSYAVGEASVRNGAEIRVDPVPGAPLEVVRRLVVGPLFNHLLHQRGSLVIHASAVQVGDVALAFMGDSGEGKSTTATAFLAAGYRILSDDVAAISIRDDTPLVQPGYPAVKLDPVALAALGDDALESLDGDAALASRDADDADDRDVHHREAGDAARRFFRVDGEWPTAPVPLAGIYRLEDGPRTEVVPLPPGRQCMELVEHTYTRGSFDLPDAPATNLRRCATVADAVPVARLRRRRSLEALLDLVGVVLEDTDCGRRSAERTRRSTERTR